MEASDPRLYFDAFAIKVSPLMRSSTKKAYKSQGGLVVDLFKTTKVQLNMAVENNNENLY
jgi:hypothetical protein